MIETIRAATLGETAEILSLWQVADAVPSRTDDPEGIQRLLEKDPGALLIATADGKIVGTVIAGFDGWRGLMYRLAVLPEYRRRGIATELIEAGERRLRDVGGRRISAIIMLEHADAVATWESNGYVEDTRVGRWFKNL